MARINNRRSRQPGSDDEDDADLSRASTPISSAPNDRKRFRQSTDLEATTPTAQAQARAKDGVIQSKDAGRVQPLSSINSKHRHQPGAIVRVKLINFVTYTVAEFFPGPNLNMVIGPNGTGKSTLVCAICLGLGWGPGLLGRAKDPSEFVKHGCKEARIEIELQRSTSGANRTNANPIIVRNIKKADGKSTFSVNGSLASAKDVKEVVGAYNIQVDNLCQFLPQDRVVEFAQMSPVQMLETTLSAAADPMALDFHGNLCHLRSEQKELVSNHKGDREELENLEKRQESQRNEVDRLKERQVVQKQIEWLGKVKPVLEYKLATTTVSEQKRVKSRLQQETAELERESGPALEKVNEKQQYAKAAKQKLESQRREVKRADGECKRMERVVQSHEQTMVDRYQKFEAERQSRGKITTEIGKHRQTLNRYNACKEQEPEPFDSRAMNEEIQDHVHRSRELKQKEEELQRDLERVNANGKEMVHRKKDLQKRVDDLNTQDGQRESRLENMSRDTFKAWQWIKSNQQRFSKEIFGPPAVTCSIRDPRMVDAVEACFGQGDFKIITIQTREDYRILQDELIRKQRLHDISLRVHSLDNLSTFKPPMSDEDLTKFGLEQWAIDCLQGPSIVLAMLCSEKFLHQTAITSKDVSQEQHDAIENSPIKTYIAGGKSVKFTRRAEYGAAGTSAMVRDIRPAKVWTDQPVDMGRQRLMNDQIKQLNIDLLEMKDNKTSLETSIGELHVELEQAEITIAKLREDKDAKQKALVAWQNLDTRIEQTEAKIQQCEDNFESLRERMYKLMEEKDDAMFEKADAVLKYCEAAHALKEANAKLLEAEVIAIQAQSDNETLQQQNKDLKEQLERKRRELQTAESELKKAVEDGKSLLVKVRAVQEEARSEADSAFSELIVEWAQPGKTMQGYAEEFESLNARLELTTGGNQNILKEFEERGKKIEKLQEKLTTFVKLQEDYTAGISELRGKFEDELIPVVSKIDEAFSESFARIGCAGQVTVYKASSTDPADCTEDQGGIENGLDFDNWAIHIYVKFREEEPLSLLDSHRQSGGERAVSTIFYLMALQSLSRSPFRVVDEINQGMDPRNERMVHGRMVDIAAANEKTVAEGGTGGSQYFLITPKLLSGLKYERGMTVLCIVSGENMPSASDAKKTGEDGKTYMEKGKRIDFAAYARRAREMGLSRSGTATGGGRRIDSGVVMSSRSIPVAG